MNTSKRFDLELILNQLLESESKEVRQYLVSELLSYYKNVQDYNLPVNAENLAAFFLYLYQREIAEPLAIPRNELLIGASQLLECLTIVEESSSDDNSVKQNFSDIETLLKRLECMNYEITYKNDLSAIDITFPKRMNCIAIHFFNHNSLCTRGKNTIKDGTLYCHYQIVLSDLS